MKQCSMKSMMSWPFAPLHPVHLCYSRSFSRTGDDNPPDKTGTKISTLKNWTASLTDTLTNEHFTPGCYVMVCCARAETRTQISWSSVRRAKHYRLLRLTPCRQPFQGATTNERKVFNQNVNFGVLVVFSLRFPLSINHHTPAQPLQMMI